MSQSPVARQVLAASGNSSPKPVPKLRKPTKRISVKNHNQAADDDDDEEPQLIMSPVVASVTVKDDSDGDSSPASPNPVVGTPENKISLRRGSVHQSAAKENAVVGSPMITITPRKDEDDAAIIICDANNDASAPQEQEKKSSSFRLKKKDNQAPLAFLKTLPSAMNEAQKKNEPVKDAGSPIVTRKSVGSNNPLNINFNNLPSNLPNAAANSNAAAANQQLPYANSGVLDNDNVKGVLLLSEAERKEFYPSDEDEDFDNYLFDLGQKETEDAEPSAAKLTESLKFTECIKNPLFDPTAPPSKEVIVQLTRDDVIRLNEVARRARERGDKNFLNYKLIDKLDKELFKEFKSKQMTRRLSTMTMRRSEKNTPINMKDIRELEDLRRGSDAGFVDDESASKVSGKYDIRKCSRR